MLLETYKKEDVILTCILPPREKEESSNSNHQYRLLEIDVNSRFYVLRLGRRESDERRLFQSPPVQDALRFCRENSDKWCRQLKVIHHIYPKEHLVEKQETPEKPPKTRKISLGDKKTVKSASFRFSASMPEDLRPINRPLPRRPDQIRGEVEVHDDPLYSNVAEETEEPQSPQTQSQSLQLQPQSRHAQSHPPPPRKLQSQAVVHPKTQSLQSPPVHTQKTSFQSPPMHPQSQSLQSQVAAEHQTVWASPINNSSLNESPARRLAKAAPTPAASSLEDRLSEDFKTKIVVHGVRVPGFDENNYADRNSKYRVVRKPVNAPDVRIKPFYKTRVQIGPDYSGGSDIPYSVVVDQVSTSEDNVYAEIGDSYPTHDRRYFSFNYQRRLHHRYDYQTGGSDGTFSGTTTSSSNAEESSV